MRRGAPRAANRFGIMRADRTTGRSSSVDTWPRLLAAHGAVASTGAPVPAPRPRAAVLSCSDARVPPSVVFAQPPGALFVIRIAGNSATAAARASLDYAVGTLGVDTIVVMGHTDCGAVGAACAGTCEGPLAPVVAPICRLANDHPDLPPDDIAALHVAATVDRLRRHDGPAGHALRDGRVEIHGAVHDVRTGRLTPVSDAPSPPTIDSPPRTTATEAP